MNKLELQYAGEHLTLFADKAIFWIRTSTLIIVDPHFGKAAAFRHAGIPVPEQVTAADLARLTGLLNATRGKRLLVLGDFFHSQTGRGDVTMRLLADWRAANRDLEIILVPGNHDQRSGMPPAEWGIEIHNEWSESPFTFLHEPESRPNERVVAGHLHPCIRLRDQFASGLRAPCFRVGESTVVLPAFGSFTGTHPIKPQRTDRIVAVMEGDIFEVPTLLF